MTHIAHARTYAMRKAKKMRAVEIGRDRADVGRVVLLHRQIKNRGQKIIGRQEDPWTYSFYLKKSGSLELVFDSNMMLWNWLK